MKLFTKIFLCTIVVITSALTVTGYLMISDSFTNAISRENQRGLEEYQMLKFTLQSGILSISESGRDITESLPALAMKTAEVASSDNQTAIHLENKQLLYSTFPIGYLFNDVGKISTDDLLYKIESRNDSYWLVVTGRFTQSDCTVYLSTARNITTSFSQKRAMQTRFLVIFIVVLCASAIIMLLLSFVLTKPIIQLIRSTHKIANGQYAERVNIAASDEIGALAYSFNQMAMTVEKTVRILEQSAQQKEDFVANFAHELKTPLTSVIGYADMIYQREGLSRQEVREAAGYIVNEGLRLEALSIKLMELFILGKQDFTFIEVRVDDLFQDIVDTLRPIVAQKLIALSVSAQDAYIRVEYDLFKTLLLNLIDNAVKAESQSIVISGAVDGCSYIISIADDGHGIPSDQLSRITEAFYVVDKSRSRSQHGAGLGLAIAVKVAELHNTRLEYLSEVHKGTTVSLRLPIDGGTL